jgi:hypothetical protein
VQINKISINNNQLSFKANYITIEKRGKFFIPTVVSTDNEENLGKEPVLQYERKGEKYEFPMVYDGKYYTTKSTIGSNKYRIYYKDTGKYERNGQEQVINPLNLIKTATKEDRIYNNLPLEQAIAKGDANGKVFVNTVEIPKDVPAILILDKVEKVEDIILAGIPENVKSIIVSSAKMNTLDHIANLTRNRYQVFSIVWDNDKFNDLKNQGGKCIYLNNESGILDYKQIGVNELTNDIANSTSYPPVTPPKLENVERLLDFDELTPQNSGNKGYRLGIMQKLLRDGILKDINIPNGFVIPEGYIKKYNDYIDVEDKEEWRKLITEGIYTQETEEKIKELGLPRRNLIIRSNFNTEDLGSFSSAGIYVSKYAGTFGGIIDEAVFDVIGNPLHLSGMAKKVHKKYGIEEKDIQPSVIIQDRIHSDYEYTVYTDDGDNNIIIDLSDIRLGYMRPANALIKYNKKTKELTMERKQSPFATYVFDEKGNIVNQKHPKDKITGNWDFLAPLLGIVTSGALVLEKFFKHPQDIEGGIGKDGKVYFWQTRDIVAKAVKRI